MNFDLLFCSTIALSFTVASLIGLGVPAAADPNIAVYIECSNGTENRQGSGILVGPNGHVLTARHVAPGAARPPGYTNQCSKHIHDRTESAGNRRL